MENRNETEVRPTPEAEAPVTLESPENAPAPEASHYKPYIREIPVSPEPHPVSPAKEAPAAPAEAPYEEIGYRLTHANAVEMLKTQKKQSRKICIMGLFIAIAASLGFLLQDGAPSDFCAVFAGIGYLVAFFGFVLSSNLKKQSAKLLSNMPLCRIRLRLYDTILEITTEQTEKNTVHIDRQDTEDISLVQENQNLYFVTFLGRLYIIPKGAVPPQSRLYALLQSKNPKYNKQKKNR